MPDEQAAGGCSSAWEHVSSCVANTMVCQGGMGRTGGKDWWEVLVLDEMVVRPFVPRLGDSNSVGTQTSSSVGLGLG